MYKREFTQDYITELKENEVFVFGSNLNGWHEGGAAYIAQKKFGAVYGQGVGLQGQSYAIPTMQGGVDTIKPYVDDFITFAKDNPDKVFLVTPIGCGIAGFKIEEIAPLFQNAIDVQNIILPKTFVSLIDKKIVSRKKLEILISKHIKSVARHMKDKHKEDIVFAVAWSGETTVIAINNETFVVNETIILQNIRYLVMDALGETGCNGAIDVDGSTIIVRVYGKPVKAFISLQRIIYKYSGFTIQWNAIKKFGSKPLDVEYLCYDEDLCKEIIEYIMLNRLRKNKMEWSLISRNLYGIDHISLCIRIFTEKGKLKSEKTFTQ